VLHRRRAADHLHTQVLVAHQLGFLGKQRQRPCVARAAVRPDEHVEAVSRHEVRLTLVDGRGSVLGLDGSTGGEKRGDGDRTGEALGPSGARSKSNRLRHAM
jgi:hypothetical protein